MNLKLLKKMNTKLFSLTLLCLLSFSFVNAQTKVTGVVSDANDPLPAASVLIKGTNRGVITDFDGNFEITASENDILVISYLGYSTQEILIGRKTNFIIVLKADSSILDEIIVVGYGTQKKKEVTGAVAKVSTEELLKVATPDLATALQGKVAGVNIQASSGSPGENANIQIRGVGSLSEGALGPLFVVDGVPYDQNPNISPEQIESIDILKDGASASIYGVRASNGVILITTKQGEEGKPSISFTSFYGIQNIFGFNIAYSSFL
jgi:TonB-dependent SusC/RagA subfamily outer membrane receptor